MGSKKLSVTFAQLEEHAKNNTPHPHWSFQWEGVPVTHENDDCYLFGVCNVPVWRNGPEVMWTKANGADAHFPNLSEPKKRPQDTGNVMTVSEALAQGYTKYGRAGEKFQIFDNLEHLSKVGEDGWPQHELYVVSKEEFTPIPTSNEEFGAWVAEMFEDSNYDETGDDTGAVEQAIKEIDFTDAVNKINEKLSGIKYNRLTNIRLVQG